MAIATVVVAAACAPAPGGGGPAPTVPPSPPVISRFAVVAARTEAPVTATFGWTISDPNGDVLTCRLDEDGDGTVDRTISDCDSADSVSVTFTGAGPRLPLLEVSDGTFGPVTASTSLSVAPGPSETFRIDLSFAPTMRPEYRAVFQAAADRWARVVVAGLPDQQLTVPQDFLGWIPAFDGTVDDVLIAARDFDIDGPRGVLGRAGALLSREFGGQAYFGIMEFDTADLDRLAAAGRLYGVILHEMGHVLGLGANWVLEGFIDDALTDPRYNGPAGVAAWQALGGTGRVPVEAGGGAGTALGHWRESTFESELMTGYSDPDERLSRLTVAGLADQGYGVDPTAADPYTVPFLSASRAGGPADAGSDAREHLDPVAPLPGNRMP
ncbi:MAG: hypothetical protein ACOYOP_09485 [Microthrixaceae bacterium]